jgi:hypothetical protein
MGRKKTQVGAALAAAFAIGVGAPAASASPAPRALNDCADGRMCGWEHADYNSAMWSYTASTAQVHGNDKWSALYNRTSRRVWYYEGANYGGKFHYISSGHYDRTLETTYDDNGRNWNDRISSIWI